jgi:hypothetical protein
VTSGVGLPATLRMRGDMSVLAHSEPAADPSRRLSDFDKAILDARAVSRGASNYFAEDSTSRLGAILGYRPPKGPA